MSFIPYQSNPHFVLPPRVGDFIPQDDLCWVTADVVDMLDLSGIKGKYSDYGAEAAWPQAPAVREDWLVWRPSMSEASCSAEDSGPPGEPSME